MSFDKWEYGPLPLVVPQTIPPSCEIVSDKCLPRHEQSQRQEDLLTFRKKDPEALRTSTKVTAQPQAQPKKPTEQPKSSNNKSNNKSNSNKSNNQRPYRHHPSLASSNLRHPHQATTPTSSVAATRANSPVTHRTTTTTPVYNPRQAQSASTNATVVARGHSRALTPQTANQLSADLARTCIIAELEASEEESGTWSGDSSDDEDDDDDE